MQLLLDFEWAPPASHIPHQCTLPMAAKEKQGTKIAKSNENKILMI